MPQTMPVAHSILSPEGLAGEIARAYDLPTPLTCTLVSPGVNDTYRVVAGADPFYYRVYRAGLRSPSDVAFELALLGHLQDAGVPVSVPVPRRDGTYSSDLPAPEGTRPAVLFTAAPGKVLAYTEEDGFKYGCAAARLHTAMDAFQTGWRRFRLDLDHLLEGPLRTIQPYAAELGLWNFYADLAARLRSRVQAVAPELEQGICHGDLHGHNVHQDDAGRLTFFDFDCGGPGFRAYDLAVYRWAVGRHAQNLQPWEAFLAGYRTVREIRPVDLAIIPTFVVIRNFWLLGLHAGQVNQRGTSSVQMWLEGAARALQEADAI